MKLFGHSAQCRSAARRLESGAAGARLTGAHGARTRQTRGCWRGCLSSTYDSNSSPSCAAAAAGGMVEARSISTARKKSVGARCRRPGGREAQVACGSPNRAQRLRRLIDACGGRVLRAALLVVVMRVERHCRCEKEKKAHPVLDGVEEEGRTMAARKCSLGTE